MSRRNETPLEESEQTCLFQWAALMANAHPELRLLHAIPNGGLRSKTEAARMKDAGVRRGVPDVFLPVARQGQHGLYIEMKRRQGGVVSDEQTWWHVNLAKQGYAVAVCFGWDDARVTLESYLGIENTGR